MATKLDPYIPYDISQLWDRRNPGEVGQDALNPAGVNPGAMLAGGQPTGFETGFEPGSNTALAPAGSGLPSIMAPAVPAGVNPGSWRDWAENSGGGIGADSGRPPLPRTSFAGAHGNNYADPNSMDGNPPSPVRDYHSPLPPAKDNMDPATMPLPTGVTRQGDYSLHGMPGMPGGPTRRSMVFTG